MIELRPNICATYCKFSAFVLHLTDFLKEIGPLKAEGKLGKGFVLQKREKPFEGKLKELSG